MIKIWHYNQIWPIKSDYFSLNGYGIGEPMPPGIVDRPHGTGDYLFMYFFDPVVIKINGDILPIDTHMLVAWKPGSYQYYGHKEHGYNHSWVHCAGSLVDELVGLCGVPLDRPIEGLKGERFEHHLRSVHFECDQQIKPDRRIVENHVRCLFCEIQRAVSGLSGAGSIPQKLFDVRQFIETRYREKITLKGLAEIACVSPAHFCVQFKEKFGCSPIGYVLRVRLSQAAYLLHDRNLRINEIADRVGIEDVYYFSKLFKRRYGKSPREMRGTYTVKATV